MNLADLDPRLLGLRLLAVAIVLGLAAAGVFFWEREQRNLGAAVVRAEHAEQALAERARQDQAAKEQDHEDQAHAEQRAAAADAVADSVRRLRERAAAVTAHCSAPAAAVGASAPQAGDLPAEVLGRLAEAAGRIAAFADSAADAAASCATRYDSLSAPP